MNGLLNCPLEGVWYLPSLPPLGGHITLGFHLIWSSVYSLLFSFLPSCLSNVCLQSRHIYLLPLSYQSCKELNGKGTNYPFIIPDSFMGLNKKTISVKADDCMQSQPKPHSLKHPSQWLSLFAYVESLDFCYSHCCNEAPTKKQLRGKGEGFLLVYSLRWHYSSWKTWWLWLGGHGGDDRGSWLVTLHL